MKISKTHQKIADFLGSQRALDHPEEFLGPNWKDVLNFWFFLDTLNEDQWKSISDRYWALDEVECQIALNAAYDAARAAANAAAGYVAWFAAQTVAADYATRELIGSHILKEQGKSLVFFPMFLNL